MGEIYCINSSIHQDDIIEMEYQEEFEWVMSIKKQGDKQVFLYNLTEDNEIKVTKDLIIVESLISVEGFSGNEILQQIMQKVSELQQIYRIKNVILKNCPYIQPDLNKPRISLKRLQFLTKDHDFYSKVGFGPIIEGFCRRKEYHQAMKDLQEFSLQQVIDELTIFVQNIHPRIAHLFYVQNCYAKFLSCMEIVDKEWMKSFVDTGTVFDGFCYSTFVQNLILQVQVIIAYLKGTDFQKLGDAFRYFCEKDIHTFNYMIVQGNSNNVIETFYPSFAHISTYVDFSWSKYLRWIVLDDFCLE